MYLFQRFSKRKISWGVGRWVEDLVLRNIMETPGCFFSKIRARMLTEDCQCACGVCLHKCVYEEGKGRWREGEGGKGRERMKKWMNHLLGLQRGKGAEGCGIQRSWEQRGEQDDSLNWMMQWMAASSLHGSSREAGTRAGQENTEAYCS